MSKWTEFEANLKARYDVCEDAAATPSSILLAVLNAVADVNAAPEASGADYRQIAHLIGSIFFAGDFKAETANERELEALLIKTGHRYQSWDEITALNPAPPTSGVDWRGHYIEVTAMRYMDNGLHRAAAMKAAEREARSMEAMAGTMQTVTMPTPADESGASGDVARWRRHDPEIEREAEAIYNAMPFNERGQKPAWVPHGNSLKQDEARDAARLARGGSHD